LDKVPRDEIRRLILTELERHPDDIAKVAAEHFGITRQAVHRHLDSLLKDGLIEASGRTRRKRYTLKCEIVKEVLSLKGNRDEDRVWRTLVEPHLMGLKSQEVFDCYADPEVDDYAFSRTRVPLRLAQYGQDLLVSRSQARRVLARFERFKEVFLDFSAVESIGQAFADEIFRVYATGHPEIKLTAANTNEQVTRMIRRARAGAREKDASGAD
jgi:DNA-binding transcriptional ArsR family regulator